VRPADSFIVKIRSFKTFRIRFIFDFKIVFIKNFLKMAPTRVRFSPGFHPGAGFPGEHVFCEFSEAPLVIRTLLEQIPLREILLLEDTRAKVHMDWRYFKNISI
jgi:hypothetical protein